MNKQTLTTTLTAFAVLAFSTAAWANHPNHDHSNHGGMPMEASSTLFTEECFEDALTIRVQGLVCDFCARSLEKVFGKQKAVNDIKVNLKDGLVSLTLNKSEPLQDEKLMKLFTHAGFNVESIERGCSDGKATPEHNQDGEATSAIAPEGYHFMPDGTLMKNHDMGGNKNDK